MHISKINDQSYSKELENKIKREKRKFLEEGRTLSSQKPYTFNQTDDKLTLLFEKTGEWEGTVSLPFTTNVTYVTNTTDYTKEPIFNEFKNLFLGALESVQPEKLTDFLNQLKNLNVTELKFVYKEKNTQDPDGRYGERRETVLSNPGRTIKQAEGSNLEEKIENIQTLFITADGRKFEIDPESLVRVEKRSKKNSELYVASLSYRTHIGLSGVPGLKKYVKQKIQAKVTK